MIKSSPASQHLANIKLNRKGDSVSCRTRQETRASSPSTALQHRCLQWKLQSTGERRGRRHWKAVSPPTHTDVKRYCENGYGAKSDVQIWCGHPNCRDIPYRTTKAILRLIKNPKTLGSPEQKEQGQTCTVLAHTEIESDRGPRGASPGL